MATITIPEKKVMTMYLLYLSLSDFFHIAEADYSINDKDWVMVKSFEVEVSLDGLTEETLRAMCVENLHAKRAEIYAEASKKADKVQEQIQQLLAIGQDKKKEIDDELF